MEPGSHAVGQEGVSSEAVALAGVIPGAVSVSLDSLYRTHYAPMVRLAHLITGSNEVAEDLVQEAFVGLHGRDFSGVANPAGYLRSAVVNRCRSWQRRAVLERRHSPGTGAGGSPVVQPGEVDETLAALARLRPRQRAALVLRFYADLSEAEIASTLGCRPGTVKSLISRGLAELKETISR